MRWQTLLGAALLAVATLAGATEENVMVGRFSAGDLTDWQSKTFQGETRYGFDDPVGDGRCSPTVKGPLRDGIGRFAWTCAAPLG